MVLLLLLLCVFVCYDVVVKGWIVDVGCYELLVGVLLCDVCLWVDVVLEKMK